MSRHLSEEELILHHYGESADAAAAESHLGGCADCREASLALRRILAAVSDGDAPPERAVDYGAQVWRKRGPQLGIAPARARVLPFVRRYAPLGAIAASVLMAFLLGRATRERELRVALQQPISPPARERILLVAVGEHLERSQMVLIELQNSGGQGAVDFRTERQRAEELVPANRLYRQAALRAGEPGVASVLEDLERVLLEIAMSPDQLAQPGLDEIKRRIEAQGILFKVRVVGSQVREREQARETKGNWSKS
jgi:hypothetical protein